MAVESSPFRGVRLSGKDATTFREQVRSKTGHKNAAASSALAEGRQLLKGLDSKGFVHVKASK